MNPLAELRRQAEVARIRQDITPSERVMLLRSLRESVNTALGDIDRYLGDLELEREAEAMHQDDEAMQARADADIREEMIRRGLATAETMDEIGVLSHEQLDDLAEEHGTLSEALNLSSVMKGVLSGSALAQFNKLHPRGRGGKWIEVFGKVSKLGEGDRAHVGQGVTVSMRGGEYHVKTPSGSTIHRGVNAEAAAQAAHTHLTQPRRGAASPGSGPGFQEKAKEFEQRANEQVAKRAKQARADLESGRARARHGPATTADLTDAEVHLNAANKMSQHTLGRYAREAASSPTTIERFSKRDPETGKRVWHSSRRELHETIIDAMLRQMKWDPAARGGKGAYVDDPQGAYLQPSPEPEVLFSGGGYAAGKSSVLKILSQRGEVPDSNYEGPVLTIDPDRIKALLPEFRERISSDPEANVLVYEEAWEVAQEVQRRAIEKRLNVVVDGISNTSPDEMIARARAFTDKGYKARAIYVDIPTDEALRRAAHRAQNATEDADKRMIPEVVLRAVHRDVAATVPELINRAQAGDIDLPIEVWDNDQGRAEDGSFNPPKRFVSFNPSAAQELESGIQVDDDALWRRFRSKAFEEVPSVDVAPGTESVGITPFRPEDEGTADFYHSTKFKAFEDDLVSMAEEAGVTIAFRERVTGFWEGEQEPSYQVQLHDGDKIPELISTLGRKYQQEGVVSFRPNAEGESALFVLSGIDPAQIAAALGQAGIPGATIRGNELQVIGGAETADKVAALREALGLDAADMRVILGDFNLVDLSGQP